MTSVDPKWPGLRAVQEALLALELGSIDGIGNVSIAANQRCSGWVRLRIVRHSLLILAMFNWYLSLP